MSELNNQNNLLKQLEKLRLEKELLEKHVFVLHDCLSVEELKAKISDLERKKEMLISVEDLIGRLRTEIEPLNYLKSVLENKLVAEDQLNKIENSEFDMNILKTSTGRKYSQSQSTQSIPTDSIKTNSVSSQKLNFKNLGTIETPKSNTGSIVNDGSLDECMQLLDQYDVVTEQEMLNFSEQHSKTLSFNQEPTTSFMNDIDNEIQDDQTVTTSRVEDLEQLKNKENNIFVKRNTDNSVTRDIANSENCCSSQLCEASTSQPLKNEKNSDSHPTLDDFLSNVRTLLLKQEVKKQMFSTKECSSKRFIINDIGDSSQKLDVTTSKSDKKSTAGDPSMFTQQLLKNPIEQSDSIKVESKSNKSLTGDSTIVSSNMKEYNNETPDGEIDLISLQNVTTNSINEPAEAESNLQNLSQNSDNSEMSNLSFNDMDLKIEVLRGIYSLGFVAPTSLQQRVIMQCLEGCDVIVYSGSNYGRTMMFTIPLLQRINTNLNECQALIIVPNRFLAVHIQKTITRVGEFLGVNVCIGGDNVPKKLSVVPHVIVGTPAGITSMIECKSLLTECIHTVVINKADMMLTHNYTKLIIEILEKLVKTKQVTVLTSDKLDHVLDLYMDLLRDPAVIINSKSADDENQIFTISPLKQFYLNIPEDWKLTAFSEIYGSLKMQRAVVFCNTFDKAQTLYQLLQRVSYSVSLFNIEMSTHERENKLEMFSSNRFQVIITTDPVEGYQFQHADWIVNYDLPVNPIDYQNRIAKCDEDIRVINLINENDDHIKSAIETYCKTRMIQLPLNMIDALKY